MKSTVACKNHKEAERRRRQRINNHLSTLRCLLPKTKTTKSNKASLLAEVVNRVKELKKRVLDVGAVELCSDEATLSFCDRDKRIVKVILCCEDRPGLNRDFSQAIRSVRAKAVKAEMMTIGGRTKSVVVMQWTGGGGDGDGDGDVEEEMGALKRALKSIAVNWAVHGLD